MLRRASNLLAQQAPRLHSAVSGATSIAPAFLTTVEPHCHGHCSCHACKSRGMRAFSSMPVAAESAVPDYSNVPLGHLNSDLSSEACNISLNRRRDLSLRQDVFLTTMQGEKLGIQQWLRGKNVVIFGIPDGGSVCIGNHIPSYEKLASEIRKCSIQDVVCVMVGELAEVQSVAAKAQAKMITFAADVNGAFTRMLGLDLAEPRAAGPRSQRYAGIVENGILTKLKVEKNVGEVKSSGCERILELLDAKRQQRLKYATA